MSRIKFLDVLEETKSKPMYNSRSHDNMIEEDINEVTNRREQISNFDIPKRTSRSIPKEINRSTREFTRDNTLAYETGYTGKRSVTEGVSGMKPASNNQNMLGFDDTKVLWTGALFVLFGGILFLSGYWVGKTITDNVKNDREKLISQSLNKFSATANSEPSSLSHTAQPVASTVDSIPVAPPKPIKVIQPAIAETKPTPKQAVVKPVAKKEYIIQVSAHSTIESARIVEDKLRSAGFEAYTSESSIGDSVFFRVRIRGFSNKKAAQDTLIQIKNQNFGADGFVLTLD